MYQKGLKNSQKCNASGRYFILVVSFAKRNIFNNFDILTEHRVIPLFNIAIK